MLENTLNKTFVDNKFNLKKRIALVTGGAGLLSAQHANAVLKGNGILILVDINKKKLNSVSKKLSASFKHKIYFFVCDITNEKKVLALKNKLKKMKLLPDILINNAAVDFKPNNSKNNNNKKRLEFLDINQLRTEVEVGLIGAVICTKIFGSEMAKKKHGVILNIGSDLSFISPDQKLYKDPKKKEFDQMVKPVSYSIVKHGILGLTRYTANYWPKKNIRCNLLAPGGIQTNQPLKFRKKLNKLIPLGRMAKVNEYEETILYMISDASSYMNGSSLIIDGGRTSL